MEQLTWKIRPFEGFGPLMFGMTPEEVQDVLGAPQKIHRSKFRPGKTEIFRYPSVHVQYDKKITIILIEVVPECNPSFEGIMLVGLVDKVRHNLRDVGYEGVERFGTIDYEDIGVSLYSPDEKVIESTAAYSREFRAIESKLIENLKKEMNI